MNHSFFTGSELNKCTKLFDAYYFPLEDLSFFEIGGNNLDHLHSSIHLLFIRTAHGYLTIIGDINLYSGTSNNLINGLTTLSNHITNSIRINLNRDNLRCISSNFRSGSSDSRFHTIVHYIQSCLTTSRNSTFHNRSGQSMNLDIHLYCRDTFRGSCHFKIHISKEVFQPLNICKQHKIIIRFSGNQTTGNTCHHLFNRYTGSHQRHTGCTSGSHGSGSIRLKSLGNGPDCIRELLLTGKYRNQSSFSQSAMTDLSSSGSAGRFGLAYGIGREIIVMHISLAHFILIQSINFLLFG